MPLKTADERLPFMSIRTKKYYKTLGFRNLSGLERGNGSLYIEFTVSVNLVDKNDFSYRFRVKWQYTRNNVHHTISLHSLDVGPPLSSCFYCGKMFQRKKWHLNRYCSDECRIWAGIKKSRNRRPSKKFGIPVDLFCPKCKSPSECIQNCGTKWYCRKCHNIWTKPQTKIKQRKRHWIRRWKRELNRIKKQRKQELKNRKSRWNQKWLDHQVKIIRIGVILSPYLYRKYFGETVKKVRLVIDRQHSLLGIVPSTEGITLHVINREICFTKASNLCGAIEEGIYLAEWSDEHDMLITKVVYRNL